MGRPPARIASYFLGASKRSLWEIFQVLGRRGEASGKNCQLLFGSIEGESGEEGKGVERGGGGMGKKRKILVGGREGEGGGEGEVVRSGGGGRRKNRHSPVGRIEERSAHEAQ